MKKINIQQILAALVGIFCVSVGVAFNNCAGWGMMPLECFMTEFV